MIQFEHPSAFLLLLLLPALYFLRKSGIFSKSAFPLTLSDWGGRTFVYKSRLLSFISTFSKLLAVTAFIFLVTALANPIHRRQEKVYTSRGSDILFVLDTSPSMASLDISLVNETITRLEAAKTGIKTLSSSQTGANYGIVAMASEAACIVPPTGNIEFLKKCLDSIEPGDFGEGSALGTGLTTAVYHLSSGKAPKKCIVLITDGENNAGQINPQTAAELACENGITIYTLGIGTKGSVPIEYTDKKTGRIHSGFYESNFNTQALEEIAEATGGQYFGIDSIASLSASLFQISRKEDSEQTFQYRSYDTDYYSNFLVLSLIFFASAWILKRLFISEIL